MKKLSFIIISLAALLVSVASCQKTDTENVGFSITQEGNIEVPFYASDAEANYTVENPVDGAEVKVDVQNVDWIEVTDVSVPGTVSFSVAENTSDRPRNVIMTLRYVYGGSEVSAQVNVLQAARNYGDLNASYTMAYYYGDLSGTQGMRYTLYLMENPLRGEYFGVGLNYCLDFYAGAPEDLNAITPPEGTYTLSGTGESGTMGIAGTSLIDMELETETFFKEGTLTISKDGDVSTYIAELKDSVGGLYHVVYTGKVLFDDASYYSTLTEDHEADMEGSEAVAGYFGDYYGVGYSNFMILIKPAGQYGAALEFDLLAPISSNASTGIAEGTYDIEDTGKEKTAFTGIVVDNTIAGSWFYTASNGSIQSPMAPLSSGTLQIDRDGDVYTFTLKAKDDAHEPHAVTAEWSGTMQVTDYATQGAPARALFCKSFCE